MFRFSSRLTQNFSLSLSSGLSHPSTFSLSLARAHTLFLSLSSSSLSLKMSSPSSSSSSSPPFTSQTSEFNQTTAHPDVMNLMIGQPSPSLLPLDLIRRSVSHWGDEGLDPLVLQYGAGLYVCARLCLCLCVCVNVFCVCLKSSSLSHTLRRGLSFISRVTFSLPLCGVFLFCRSTRFDRHVRKFSSP